jgi:hypothetical protein
MTSNCVSHTQGIICTRTFRLQLKYYSYEAFLNSTIIYFVPYYHSVICERFVRDSSGFHCTVYSSIRSVSSQLYLTRKTRINRQFVPLGEQKNGLQFCKNMVTADWIRTLPIDAQLTENCQWYLPSMDLQMHGRGVIRSDRCGKMAHQFGTSSAFYWVYLECRPGGRWACNGIICLRENAQNVRKRDGRVTKRMHTALLLLRSFRHVYVRVRSRRMQLNGLKLSGCRLE